MSGAADPSPSDGLTQRVVRVLQLVSALIAGELSLVRAEMALAVRRAVVGIAFLVVAVLSALVAIITLAGAAVDAVVLLGVPRSIAGLIVALALTAAAAVLVRVALALLAPSNLIPRRSIDSLCRIAAILNPKVKPDGTDQTRTETPAAPGPDRDAD